jgi:hypothetical protein
MALTDKTYERIFSETGSDGDLITADEKALMKKEFDENTYIDDKDALVRLGPVLYQLQLITEELDYLRTEISNNKDKTGITTSQANAITANTAKTSFPGLGTTSTTALAGDTTTISTTQANEITASTKLGLRLQASRQASLTKSTTIEFGEFTTTVSGKTTTYSIPITVVETDTSGKSTVTTTKTGSIPLM